MTSETLSPVAQVLKEQLDKYHSNLTSNIESLTFVFAGNEAVNYVDWVIREQNELCERWAAGEPKDPGWMESWVQIDELVEHLAGFFFWYAEGLERKDGDDE